jgi:hypothetical protein
MLPTRLYALDRESERQLAAGLFNDVWRLLEMPRRQPEQDDEMLHAAHAPRYHIPLIGAFGEFH